MKLNWFDRENPERLALTRYRNPENIHKEEVLQDFLEFVEEEGIEQIELDTLKAAIQYYLGYDEKKVQQGEQTLLTRWIQSVKGE